MMNNELTEVFREYETRHMITRTVNENGLASYSILPSYVVALNLSDEEGLNWFTTRM